MIKSDSKHTVFIIFQKKFCFSKYMVFFLTCIFLRSFEYNHSFPQNMNQQKGF